MAKTNEESRWQRMSLGDSIAILVSVLALLVSGLTLYLQSVHERSRLSMRLMEFTLEPRSEGGPICKIEIALFNSGNRDAALAGASLSQAKTTRTSAGTTSQRAKYFPPGDAPGQLSHVVKSGEISFVGLAFPGCDFENIKTRIEKEGLVDFSLSTLAFNHEGQRSSVETSFAAVAFSPAGRLTFSLELDGYFDLLADRRRYAGSSDGVTKTVWLEGSGRDWRQGYEISETSRSAPNW
jgi:hypothetical protein